MSDGYLSVAETAKLLRAQLKKNFPNTKFSVRSDSYAGGASINVSWIDGPTDDQVKRITGMFTGADFDGMIDLKTYNSSWLLPDGSACVAKASGTVGSMGYIPAENNTKPHPDAKLVHFGADFIFCNRRYSAELLKEAVREVCLKYNYEVCPVEDDGAYGAHIPYNNPLAEQGGDNPTSIWTLRNLAHAWLEQRYPFEPARDPQPGDDEYEALKAKVEALERKCGKVVPIRAASDLQNAWFVSDPASC